LPELETVFQELYGLSEIDYERRKSDRTRIQTIESPEPVSDFLASATNGAPASGSLVWHGALASACVP
jgi:hypothetical protein